MRIDHVTIATDDLETTVAFYRDVLGLVIGPRPAFPFARAWLYADGRPIVHLKPQVPRGAPLRRSIISRSTRTISLVSSRASTACRSAIGCRRYPTARCGNASSEIRMGCAWRLLDGSPHPATWEHMVSSWGKRTSHYGATGPETHHQLEGC